jgi:hypothetical protein
MPGKTKAPEAVIEFSGAEPPSLEQIALEHPQEVVLVRAKGLGADDYTLQALVAVVPLTIRLLTPIIRAHIEAKQHVRLKVDGIEVQGVDPDEIIRVLSEMAAIGDRE